MKRILNNFFRLLSSSSLVISSLAVTFLISGCAALYHVQVADVQTSDRGRIIDVKVSETAFDLKGAAGDATKAVRHHQYNIGNDKEGDALAFLELLIALSNFGPVTGKPVFTDRYANTVLDQIIEKCPSGRITGLTSIREARNYPYISGEIVHVRGFCVD